MDGLRTDQFEVEVNYNGVSKKFEVTLVEVVGILRAEAIHKFGITQNPHLFGLFTPDNRELQDNQTIREDGVKPNEKLNLRPSAVRGGGR
jgi:hypothetical protein